MSKENLQVGDTVVLKKGNEKMKMKMEIEKIIADGIGCVYSVGGVDMRKYYKKEELIKVG